MYSVIREKFELIVKENDLLNETVIIRAKPLTPEEAIGNPECEDFPILKGHERLMQAEFRGSFGQAYTDMHGNFEGTLRDILDMELTNNFRRAIFIASLNAVMRNLGLIKGSVHCKDRGPEECGEDLVEFLGKYGRSRIALIGFQPVHARCCSGTYELKILDMDCDNIGKEKFGVVVLDGSRYLEEVLKWCDLALVTGTTVVNGTIEPILDIARKKSVFYGISIAGVACLLGLERFCPRST
ncbi:MAG: Rossmann-like domain-containing protein [Methanosarcinaceae archaeon]